MAVVHVRNLSTQTDEDKLKEKLDKYGKIEKIDIIRERATGYFISINNQGYRKDMDFFISKIMKTLKK